MGELWPWLILFGLGAYHGVNPGMGWLFAVALGLQERKRMAVIQALFPIALGHALSVGLIVVIVILAQAYLPPLPLKMGAAAVLFAFGAYRLIRARHPNWVGMRVGFRDLAIWSFIMASAHGAGLMLVPVFLGSSSSESHAHDMSGHAGHAQPIDSILPEAGAPFFGPLLGLAAVAVHTLGHLLVAGLIALIVYEKIGVAILRRAWFNLDLLWVIALMLSGIVILVF